MDPQMLAMMAQQINGGGQQGPQGKPGQVLSGSGGNPQELLDMLLGGGDDAGMGQPPMAPPPQQGGGMPPVMALLMQLLGAQQFAPQAGPGAPVAMAGGAPSGY